MPKAVASKETHREDLKKLPGGFVVLRKFNYGETLKRRQLGTAAKFAHEKGEDPEMEMGFNFPAVQWYEFTRAIVEHNLEDENGKTLNFKNRAEFEKLDPIIAQEVAGLIDEYNGSLFGDDEEDLPENPTNSKSTEPSSTESSLTIQE